MLETTSNLYRKRLVRVLNDVGLLDGFYAFASTFKVRCNRARIRSGELEVRSPVCSPEWFKPASERFEDVYGREIVASRRG